MFREVFDGLVDARLSDLTQMQRRMRKQDRKYTAAGQNGYEYCRKALPQHRKGFSLKNRLENR